MIDPGQFNLIDICGGNRDATEGVLKAADTQFVEDVALDRGDL